MDEAIKNIFFDFDGVLVESIDVKTQAFYKLYEPYGIEIASKAMQHHIENGGMSRFEKFKLYHKQYLNVDLNENEIMNLSGQFSSIVVNAVIAAPEVSNAGHFLKKYHSRFSFWIITGTPTDEIRYIVEKRNWSAYFKGIYGSPQKKDFWTEFIIKENGLNRKEIIFLGDALADFNAAQKSSLNFALRNHHQNEDLFKDFFGLRFNDFNELEKKMELA
jgi:phosphoglycolate phosphatase-like HAD superfamily hydrolase